MSKTVSKNSGIGPNGYYKKYYFSRDWRFYRGIVAQIIQTQEPGPVLDLGAGVGYLVEACHHWGINCVGLEGSIEAVDIARERFPAMNIQQGFLSDPLPYKDGAFGTVILNQVIEHLEPVVARNLVKEILRVLQVGGGVIIYSPSKFNKRERLGDLTHINLYSPTELREFIVSSGFTEYAPFDSPLPFFGESWLGRLVMRLIFRLFYHERLSATANCIAKKIEADN